MSNPSFEFRPLRVASKCTLCEHMIPKDEKALIIFPYADAEVSAHVLHVACVEQMKDFLSKEEEDSDDGAA